MAKATSVEALQAEANRLRVHSILMTTTAGSGHPTSCLSAAEIVACLYFRVMRYDPKQPFHPQADRFILSKGHAAPVFFAALAEAGAIPESSLLTLRRIDSDIEGHPTPRVPWAYVGTGSLGQGLSVGVGMALCRKNLDKAPSRIYVLLGDGECAEGAVWEAAAMASYYKLDNLVAIVDVNRLGQSQATMLGHDVKTYAARFKAFGWKALVIDGHDVKAILRAFAAAEKTKGAPTAVIAKTIKGKGAPGIEDQLGWHGKPIPKDKADEIIRQIGAPTVKPKLYIPPPPAGGEQPSQFKPLGPAPYTPGQTVATREAYGRALADLGQLNPQIVALDGDVKNSTFAEVFAKAFPQRYFECFIAEQNLVGAGMGFATCGRIPFVSSFGAFLERAADQIRMAGISRANVKFAGSHSGVSIGEDGPSQMALEDFGIFRAIPDSVVLCPCDGTSTYKLVSEVAARKGLAYIRTARPKSPVLYGPDEQFPIGGLKVLRSSPDDKLCIAACGVTVHEALKAYDELKAAGIAVRVIDLYSVKPLPTDALIANARSAGGKIVTVEDHYPEGGLGEAVAAAVSGSGVVVQCLAVTGLPRSGKAEELLDMFGLSARKITARARQILGV